jgi:hypothetical protein
MQSDGSRSSLFHLRPGSNALQYRVPVCEVIARGEVDLDVRLDPLTLVARNVLRMLYERHRRECFIPEFARPRLRVACVEPPLSRRRMQLERRPVRPVRIPFV